MIGRKLLLYLDMTNELGDAESNSISWSWQSKSTTSFMTQMLNGSFDFNLKSYVRHPHVLSNKHNLSYINIVEVGNINSTHEKRQ